MKNQAGVNMSPKNQEKKFHKQYAGELMRIAEGDLESGFAIARAQNARLENAFFMAQQAMEKSIKAVLVHLGIPVPLVHDLGTLLAKLPSSANPPYGYELSELNQFAAIRRYEEGQFDLTKEEFASVAVKTREMLDWANSQIKKPNSAK